MYYVNENVKNCLRIFPEQGRYDYLRLDMNENPTGLPEDFVQEVLKELTPSFLATYPEPDQFMKKYAAYLGVEKENLCVTNGLDMAIRYILEVFVKQGNNVVTVTPTFEMYGVNCRLLGLEQRAIAYEDDFTVSVDKIIAAIDDQTDMIVLLNPNNPIGSVYTDEEVERVLKRAGEADAVVVIDEAYHYYYAKTFMPLIKEHENVLVLRTFSKLCSLAGCRLGVIAGAPEIVGYVTQNRLTFDVNSIALKFGERILDHPEILDEMLAEEREGHKYLVEVLEENGYDIYSENGNFVFVKCKRSAQVVKEELKKQRILIKTYGYDLLKDYVRVSTGAKPEMERFVKVFLQIEKEV